MEKELDSLANLLSGNLNHVEEVISASSIFSKQIRVL